MTPARFTLEVRATAADVDAFGHVSNLVYLRWVQEAAAAHSAAVGWDAAAYLALGSFFVVRRHEIDYLVPALGGDDLAIATWVAGWRAASSTRLTEVVRRRDGVVLARATTRWVFVEQDGGRPCRIPESIAAAFAMTSTPAATTA